jgi:hypothetical protein
LSGVELRRNKSLNERRKKPQEARRRMSRADGSETGIPSAHFQKRQ